MSKSLLAQRYADALRKAVATAAELEQAANSLSEFTSFYESDDAFRYALGNPVLPAADRVRLAECVLTAIAAPEALARFIRLLVRRNRTMLLPDIARHVRNHTADWLDQVVVSVVTAETLPEPLEARIRAALEKFSGKHVVMELRVDPNIIAGLVVYMWGVFFDFSLRTRIERLRQKLLTEVDLTHES